MDFFEGPPRRSARRRREPAAAHGVLTEWIAAHAGAIAEARPALVAMTISYVGQLLPAILIAQELKRRCSPAPRVIVGGPWCTHQAVSGIDISPLFSVLDGIGVGPAIRWSSPQPQPRPASCPATSSASGRRAQAAGARSASAGEPRLRAHAARALLRRGPAQVPARELARLLGRVPLLQLPGR